MTMSGIPAVPDIAVKGHVRSLHEDPAGNEGIVCCSFTILIACSKQFPPQKSKNN